jgi:speckle-type POZ protein
MDELAKDLLVAADKYLIDLLKLQCQVALAKTLTVENCSELLALADSHSATDLKAVAIEFVLQRASDVMKSDGWKELKQTHSQLGFEVSESMMTRTQPEPQQPVVPRTLSPLRMPSDGTQRRHVNFNVPPSMMPRIVLPRLDANNPYVGPLFR